MRFAAIFFAIVFFNSIVFSQTFDLNSPTLIQGITAKVLLGGNGNISGDLSGENVIIKILSFRESPFQKIKSVEQKLKINGKEISATNETDSWGNNFAVFTVNETGDFDYSIDATIETNYSFANLQDYDLSKDISENADFILPSKNVESNDSSVRTVALNGFVSNSWLENLRDITSWTNNYVTFDWNYYPETYSTIFVLNHKRGTCDEFSTLAAGMFRVKKIPTRFDVGVSFSGNQWANHAWLEVFNPKSGWIPLDATYGEAGIVDGTHILMGNFADPLDAKNSASYPSTANISFKETKKPIVEILNFKPFENIVSIDSNDLKAKTFENIELNASVKNNLESYAIVPVQLVMHGDFSVQEDKGLILLLAPLETKTVTWNLQNNSGIKPPQYNQYEFKIVSLGTILSKEITIYPSEAKSSAKIVIKGVLPKFDGKKLEIEIDVENFGMESANIDINLDTIPVFEKTEEIKSLSKKTIIFTVENFDATKVYNLSIKTPTTIYLQQIAPIEGEKLPENNQTNQNPSGNGLEQIIPKNLNLNASSLDKILTLDNLIIAASILAGIAIILLLKNLLLNK